MFGQVLCEIPDSWFRNVIQRIPTRSASIEVAHTCPFSPEIGGDCLRCVGTDMADAGRQAGREAFEEGHLRERPPHPALSPKSFAAERLYDPSLLSRKRFEGEGTSRCHSNKNAQLNACVKR